MMRVPTREPKLTASMREAAVRFEFCGANGNAYAEEGQERDRG